MDINQQRESRWRGEPGVGDVPWNVKKLPSVEYQCTSSSFLLSFFYFLSLPLQQSPVTPFVISFSFSLSTLPQHFPLTHPRLSPVILFIPFFSPFCCGFPPIQVHTSQVSARPYTLLVSLRSVTIVTGRMDDRQGPAPLSSSSPFWNTPHS